MRFLTVLIFSTAIIAQTQRWVYTYPDGRGCAQSITYDSIGNLFVAGHSGGEPFYDFTVISLTVDGDTNWIYTFTDTAQEAEHANSIILGSNGNIYAVGSSGEYGLLYQDFTVISLSKAGNERWIYRYNGSGNERDEARSVAGGTDENIYVVGFTTDSNTYHDFCTVSLDSLGNERWTYSYFAVHGFNGTCEGYDIVAGDDGHLYAAGMIAEDFGIISFDTIGTENWIYQKNGGSPPTWDIAYSIVYGNDGNLYAAGYLFEADSGEIFTVISTTSSGGERWVYTYNGSESAGFDQALSVAYGEDDNIYAIGYSHDSITNVDFTVISLDTTGRERWVYTHAGTNNYRWDEGLSITYGSDGNVYAAGYIEDTTTNADFIVICLDTSGTELWTYGFDASAHVDDKAFTIIYGNDGNLYIGGFSQDSLTGENFTVVSLNPSNGIEEDRCVKWPSPYAKFFPNPFNDRVTIDVDVYMKNPITFDIEIYDVTGRLVRYLKQNIPGKRMFWDGRDNSGKSLSSGVYFIKFTTGNVNHVKKVLLTR